MSNIDKKDQLVTERESSSTSCQVMNCMDRLLCTKWKQSKQSLPRSEEVEFGEGGVVGTLAIGTEKHEYVVGNDIRVNDFVVDCVMDGRNLKLDCEEALDELENMVLTKLVLNQHFAGPCTYHVHSY